LPEHRGSQRTYPEREDQLSRAACYARAERPEMSVRECAHGASNDCPVTRHSRASLQGGQKPTATSRGGVDTKGKLHGGRWEGRPRLERHKVTGSSRQQHQPGTGKPKQNTRRWGMPRRSGMGDGRRRA